MSAAAAADKKERNRIEGDDVRREGGGEGTGGQEDRRGEAKYHCELR